MNVLHKGEIKKISELPKGKYLPKSERYNFPTDPLIEKSELKNRIRELEYDSYDSEIEVIGPFKYLNLVPHTEEKQATKKAERKTKKPCVSESSEDFLKYIITNFLDSLRKIYTPEENYLDEIRE